MSATTEVYESDQAIQAAKLTGGSHDAIKHRLIGEVRNTPNGPVFEPADDPNGFLDCAEMQP